MYNRPLGYGESRKVGESKRGREVALSLRPVRAALWLPPPLVLDDHITSICDIIEV